MFNITVDGDESKTFGEVAHFLLAIPFRLNSEGRAIIDAPLLSLLYTHAIDGQHTAPKLKPNSYNSINGLST
ncbi:MAG: hypothetical protein GY792_00410 [Gammaproteobacteria bacterium]|nr:hypothetical protein [Gammaproteobacteria bacterium]